MFSYRQNDVWMDIPKQPRHSIVFPIWSKLQSYSYPNSQCEQSLVHSGEKPFSDSKSWYVLFLRVIHSQLRFIAKVLVKRE